jgi:hypothetical protein
MVENIKLDKSCLNDYECLSKAALIIGILSKKKRVMRYFFNGNFTNERRFK